MKMLVPQLSTSLFGKPATAGKALSGLAFPLITLSLALLQFAASNAAAQSTPVTPPGAIFNAGSVVPYKLLAGNMAGGFLGNGSGKDYDVAVGNGTGSGPQLFGFIGGEYWAGVHQVDAAGSAGPGKCVGRWRLKGTVSIAQKNE